MGDFLLSGFVFYLGRHFGMGGICPRGFFVGGICPRGLLSRWLLSGGFLSVGFDRLPET